MTDLDATFRKARRIAQAAGDFVYVDLPGESGQEARILVPGRDRDLVLLDTRWLSVGLEQRMAFARIASWAPHVLPAMVALRQALPLNGRGECFMCGLGDTPDVARIHLDRDNAWGGDQPCLEHEQHDNARAALAAWAKSVEEASDGE